MSFTVKLNYDYFFLQKQLNHHVKLTDSALKSLDELNSKNTRTGLRLRFDGIEGFLQVPIKGPEGKDHSKTYSFTTAPESKDGSIECFGLAHRTNVYKHMGTFTHKLTVRASDDVFQNTLEKMSIVELESKKNCVKEIKFRDHEKKLAHLKSKNFVPPVEPKKIPIIPKPKKPETTLRPSQNSSTVDPLDFTARVNTRIAPVMKRTAPEPHQHSSPAAFQPEIINSSQYPVVNTPVETVVEESPIVSKKPRIAHKTEEVAPTNLSNKIDIDVPESKIPARDYSSVYPPVTTEEELESYSAEFNKEYEGYVQLHDKINKRLEKLCELKDALELETFKSEPYLKVLTDFYNEYTSLMKNPQHMDERKKWLELHGRLQFIRKRVVDFDLPSDSQ